MTYRTVIYHAATKAQRLRFERACVRCLNRWAAVLDIESWDLDFIPLYGKKAQKYNADGGGKDPDWEGFYVTVSSDYRRARVRSVVPNPSDWHMGEEELDRLSLHELIHVVLSPLREECIMPWVGENDDRRGEFRYLDEHITSQLVQSIYRVAGPTRTSSRQRKRG